MNNAELDELIAAAARVDDAEVGRWDLSGTDADLCEEIMSVQTIHAPDPTGSTDSTGVAEPTVVAPAGLPSRRRVRRLALTGAAAAALTAVIAGGLAVGSSEPTGAATIDAALATSSSVLGRSGRADLRYRLEGGPHEGGDWVTAEHWAFSGEDTEVAISVAGERFPEPYPINRLVDGEFYLGTPDEDGTGYEWQHDVNGDPYAGFGLDPRTLLDELRGASPFEEVGAERLDGVETRRFRATEPRELPDLDISGDSTAGKATALDIWVDDEDVVRRLDLTVEDRYGDSAESISISFYDIGEPVTIEAPEAAAPIDPAG